MIKQYGLELSGEERLPHLVEEKAYNTSITSLSDSVCVARFCRDALQMHVKAEEYVYAIFLDNANKVIGISEISHGGCNTALAPIRETYIRALLVGSVNMIVVHNHPSTSTEPSMSDDAIASRLCEIGHLIDINLIDFVIIGGSNFLSYREEQRIIINN